jgi:hypothetical protein
LKILFESFRMLLLLQGNVQDKTPEVFPKLQSKDLVPLPKYSPGLLYVVVYHNVLQLDKPHQVNHEEGVKDQEGADGESLSPQLASM